MTDSGPTPTGTDNDSPRQRGRTTETRPGPDTAGPPASSPSPTPSPESPPRSPTSAPASKHSPTQSETTKNGSATSNAANPTAKPTDRPANRMIHPGSCAGSRDWNNHGSYECRTASGGGLSRLQCASTSQKSPICTIAPTHIACGAHQRVHDVGSRAPPIGWQREAEAEVIRIIAEPAPIMGHQNRVEQTIGRQHDQQTLSTDPLCDARRWNIVAEILQVPRRQLIAVATTRAEHANASADKAHRPAMRRAVPSRPAPNRHQERHRVTHPRHQQAALRGPRRDDQRRQRNHRRQTLVGTAHLRMQPPRRRICRVESPDHLNGIGDPARQCIHSRLRGLIPERMTTQPVRHRHHPRPIRTHDFADAILLPIPRTDLSTRRDVHMTGNRSRSAGSKRPR